MQPLRYAPFWVGGGVLLAVTIVVLSLLPGSKLPDVHMWDKAEHAFAYVALSGWFSGVLLRRHYIFLALGLVLMGVLIEMAQGTMALGRTADINDVFANGVGVLIGIAIATLGLGRWMLWVEGWVFGERRP